MGNYASKAEAIAEGMPDDARTDAALALATKYIDKVTGQWFEKRPAAGTKTLTFDGRGDQNILHLPVPVITVDNVTLDDTEIGSERYYVYSSDGPPDERRNPKIVFLDALSEGRQNVKVTGTFGFVDDPASAQTTPVLIKKACLLLAMREIPLMTAADRGDENRQARVVEERTDGHSYKLSDLLVAGGPTGDPEIDGILGMYHAPREAVYW